MGGIGDVPRVTLKSKGTFKQFTWGYPVPGGTILGYHQKFFVVPTGYSTDTPYADWSWAYENPTVTLPGTNILVTVWLWLAAIQACKSLSKVGLFGVETESKSTAPVISSITVTPAFVRMFNKSVEIPVLSLIKLIVILLLLTWTARKYNTALACVKAITRGLPPAAVSPAWASAVATAAAATAVASAPGAAPAVIVLWR